MLSCPIAEELPGISWRSGTARDEELCDGIVSTWLTPCCPIGEELPRTSWIQGLQETRTCVNTCLLELFNKDLLSKRYCQGHRGGQGLQETRSCVMLLLHAELSPLPCHIHLPVCL